jgi:hypothetical protein
MGSGKEVALITNKLLQNSAVTSVAKLLALSATIFCLPGTSRRDCPARRDLYRRSGERVSSSMDCFQGSANVACFDKCHSSPKSAETQSASTTPPWQLAAAACLSVALGRVGQPPAAVEPSLEVEGPLPSCHLARLSLNSRLSALPSRSRRSAFGQKQTKGRRCLLCASCGRLRPNRTRP